MTGASGPILHSMRLNLCTRCAMAAPIDLGGTILTASHCREARSDQRARTICRRGWQLASVGRCGAPARRHASRLRRCVRSAAKSFKRLKCALQRPRTGRAVRSEVTGRDPRSSTPITAAHWRRLPGGRPGPGGRTCARDEHRGCQGPAAVATWRRSRSGADRRDHGTPWPKWRRALGFARIS